MLNDRTLFPHPKFLYHCCGAGLLYGPKLAGHLNAMPQRAVRRTLTKSGHDPKPEQSGVFQAQAGCLHSAGHVSPPVSGSRIPAEPALLHCLDVVGATLK